MCWLSSKVRPSRPTRLPLIHCSKKREMESMESEILDLRSQYNLLHVPRTNHRGVAALRSELENCSRAAMEERKYLLVFYTRLDKPDGAANPWVGKAIPQYSGVTAQSLGVARTTVGMSQGQGPPPPSLDPPPPPYKNGDMTVCKCGDLRQDRYASIPSGRAGSVSSHSLIVHLGPDDSGYDMVRIFVTRSTQPVTHDYKDDTSAPAPTDDRLTSPTSRLHLDTASQYTPIHGSASQPRTYFSFSSTMRSLGSPHFLKYVSYRYLLLSCTLTLM